LRRPSRNQSTLKFFDRRTNTISVVKYRKNPTASPMP